MPSAFADLWSSLQPQLDAVFGEDVQLVPQVGGTSTKYLRKGADPNAAAYTITGIFTDQSIVDAVKGSGANTHENVDALTRLTTIGFDQTQFEANPLPQRGWIAVLTTQPRQPRYTIITVEPDGVARIVCKVAFLDFSA